jgi:hypothetical protein
MARIHLFEFEDQKWCPRVIRETTTDFLSAYYQIKNIYAPAFQKIAGVLDKTGLNSIIDCCSGSGGPVRKMLEYLDQTGKSHVQVTLTDKYPNIDLYKKLEAEYPEQIIGHQQSVSATELPASLQGMRTLFSSFHHFKPDMAQQILQDAVNNHAPIGIFEFTERRPKKILRVLISPFSVLLTMPRTQQMTWRKILFTYIIPVTPLTHAWECMVSNLRTYSPQELRGLVNKLDAPNYTWDIGKMQSGSADCNITYLVGYKSC